MKRIIKQIPFAKQIYNNFNESAYKHRFANDCYGCFWGVFETFEQAMQAAPQTKSIGYDNPDLAQEYQHMLEDSNWENSGRIISLKDYPMLLWLKSIIFQNKDIKVFDFGGNVGIHFYAYHKYLFGQEKLEWLVCDLPEIIKVGRQISEKRNINYLYFTNDFNDASGKNIFFSSGTIQYIDHLGHKLSSLKDKPKHILINRLPLYDGQQFVTLQNGGKVFYPQYVFNKTEFIDSITLIGYELIDIWDGVGICNIPFHPEKLVPSYTGLYFQLKR